MSKKGLIGVQMSTIAPNKMPKFDAYESMARLADIGYKCIHAVDFHRGKSSAGNFDPAAYDCCPRRCRSPNDIAVCLVQRNCIRDEILARREANLYRLALRQGRP